MIQKYKNIISLCLKVIVIISVITGVIYSILYGKINGYSVLLYFTTQSNIWILIIDFIFIIFMIKDFNKEHLYNYKLIKAYQVFVTCITVTGLVFCLILAPGYYLSDANIPDYTPFNFAAVLLHIVVPLLSVIDYVYFTPAISFSKKDICWSFIPTVYYFIFAVIGYVLNWNFGDGRNYPYFFLNFDSPAGIFGFSNEMPYFMGSFYWFFVIFGIIVGLSSLYVHIMNKKFNKETMKIVYK